MVQTTVTTGTVEAHDEIIPEDENEDISSRTRNLARLNVEICIEDGKSGNGNTNMDQATMKDGIQDSLKNRTLSTVRHEVELSDESMDA